MSLDSFKTYDTQGFFAVTCVSSREDDSSVLVYGISADHIDKRSRVGTRSTLARPPE